MLRSTWRGLGTWHGRDSGTLADERARQQGTQTSTHTGAPVLAPTYRGASGNVSQGGTVNPSCNRKSRNGNPSPKAGAPDFYPSGPQFKTDAIRGEGRGDWATYQTPKCVQKLQMALHAKEKA